MTKQAENTMSAATVAVTWLREPGTLNYVSDCGRFIAKYNGTHRSGYADYWTFPAGLAKRQQTMGRALVVGGRPDRMPVRAGGEK